jgi:hypothetical protein
MHECMWTSQWWLFPRNACRACIGMKSYLASHKRWTHVHTKAHGNQLTRCTLNWKYNKSLKRTYAFSRVHACTNTTQRMHTNTQIPASRRMHVLHYTRMCTYFHMFRHKSGSAIFIVSILRAYTCIHVHTHAHIYIHLHDYACVTVWTIHAYLCFVHIRTYARRQRIYR